MKNLNKSRVIIICIAVLIWFTSSLFLNSSPLIQFSEEELTELSQLSEENQIIIDSILLEKADSIQDETVLNKDNSERVELKHFEPILNTSSGSSSGKSYPFMNLLVYGGAALLIIREFRIAREKSLK